jgi:transcriptional antiterminator RfaH
MPYWVAQTEPNREAAAVHFLKLNSYEPYLPQIREGRRGVRPLFPSYCFLVAVTAWYRARWCPGIVRLIGLEGHEPAVIPDAIIDDIKRRERDGLVVLAKPKPPQLKRGDEVRITAGLFVGQLAVYEGMRAHERVAVLLAVLGKVELPKGDIAVLN